MLTDDGIRVGIVANEFFDAGINRVGGFGWAARRAADSFSRDSDFAGYVYFSGEHLRRPELCIDGAQIIGPRARWHQEYLRARRERLDILLCIDYRPAYLRWFRAIPRTPVVVWVRDPRTPAAMKRVNSLTVPGSSSPPGGVADWDVLSLKRFMGKTRWLNRRVLLACKMSYMREMIPEVFGLPDPEIVLPNPDVIDYSLPAAEKTPWPRVVFLARLDPIKRPWLFVELARRFPETEFLMLGQHFVDNSTTWLLEKMPDNVKALGNVSGARKLELVASSWALINTAIHDESAVSNLEALACETPLISYIESDQLASRFGICLGYDAGDGLDSIDRLVGALKRMLDDHEWRRRVGKEGRAWVMSEHNTQNFLSSFKSICAQCGVRSS